MYNKNNIFGYSNQRKEIKKRTWTVVVILILMFSFLIWKSVYNMYIEGPARKAMADAQYRIDQKKDNMNYILFDCKGKKILKYNVNYYAAIDPVDYSRFNEYTSKYDLETLTITLRNYNREYDLEKLKDDRSGEKVRYKIDDTTYKKLQNIKGVKGFYAYEANEVIQNKNWKIENLLINTTYNKAQVDPLSKNIVNELVSKSDDSLEMQIYNKVKNNEYTKVRFDKDVNGEISEGKIIKPKSNINVRLTLNKEIQDKVESILHEEKYKKYDQIGVVLMESSTGKIRAMAQKDDNAYNVNLGISGTNGFYAGSIFKVIVDEAGIDKNLIDNNKIYTIDYSIKIGGHEQLSKYTVAQALAYSSNKIFAQLGKDVGLKNMENYAEKQGMLGKVLNFQQEESGKIENARDGKIYPDLAAIGQNVRITPLEALSIPNTIINNGIYVQPSIVDAYVNDDNKILEEITSRKLRVLKRETSEMVKLHMMDVVNKGTGTQAYIKGMSMGGKTGTSEYYVMDKEHVLKGKKCSDGWFVGFFNLNGKNYSMVVFVPNIYVSQDDKTKKEGKADEEGGTTAAPIFKEVVNALKAMDKENSKNN
jgi:cell division protein FtsI/penicillin-binding protein 2